MNGLGFWIMLLGPGLLAQTAADTPAQHSEQHSAKQEFVSGGTIRFHLEAGGYTITPSDSEKIVVTCHANSEEQLQRVKVEIKRTGTSADIHVSETPHNNFQATIEVPRSSNLWVRLSAGEVVVKDVEGDKNVQVLAGRIQIDVPHPEMYGHRDASVTTGSIEASAFDVSKGGLFRSFEQHGPGKYRLHAHVITGEIDLRGNKSTKV
jgi:phage baseplate assembly protein gpV